MKLSFPSIPRIPSQNLILCIFSLNILITNFVQINGLFLLKHKLAFAPQQDNEREIHKEANATAPSSNPAPKVPFESINFGRDVEKIYEKWMLEKRNQMFKKMKQGVASRSEAQAFQQIMEEYFDSCICDADEMICRIYALSC